LNLTLGGDTGDVVTSGLALGTLLWARTSGWSAEIAAKQIAPTTSGSMRMAPPLCVTEERIAQPAPEIIIEALLRLVPAPDRGYG
jgi:hypothetical protein